MGRRHPHPDRDAPSPEEVEGVLREHGAVLRLLHLEGRAAWPEIPLPYEVFAPRVVALVHRRPLGVTGDVDPGKFVQRLARVFNADIYLAIACEEKVPGAWEVFVRRYGPGLQEAARTRRSPGTDSEEIAQGLAGELFSPPADGRARTRIGTYDGSGPLGAWLLAVLRNRIADQRRANAGEGRRRAASALLAPNGVEAPPAEEPLHAILSQEARARFEGALRRGWRRLTPGESIALACRYRDGMPQSRIARLLGVGPPRVSRILAKGLEKIRREVARDFDEETLADLV